MVADVAGEPIHFPDEHAIKKEKQPPRFLSLPLSAMLAAPSTWEAGTTSRPSDFLTLNQGRVKAMKKSTDEMTRYCLPSIAYVTGIPRTL